MQGSSNIRNAERIAWLLSHPDLWQNKIDPYLPKLHLTAIDQLAKGMHLAGLYSPNTIIQDIRMGVVKLLQVIGKPKQ